MKLCIVHEPFDSDVSSGTIHAAHQWHELCMAFNVTHLAVINKTELTYPKVNDSVQIIEVSSVDELKGNKVFIELGDYPNIKNQKISSDDWIVIGGSDGVQKQKSDVCFTIPTNISLYPREAATVVLWEQFRG